MKPVAQSAAGPALDVRNFTIDEYGNGWLTLTDDDLARLGFTELDEEFKVVIEVFDDELSATGKALSIRKARR